jgi:hypothetical protein
MAIAKHFVREQGTQSIGDYQRRVARLAALYIGIVLAATSASVLIVVRGQFFVTLSQRSNVETLTLVFILVLFTYLTILSLPGAWGALKIVYYNAPAWLGRDRLAVERRKQAALKWRQGASDAVYLNCRVHQRGQDDAPIRIPLQDEAGSLGTIVIDGAKMSQEQSPEHSSNSLLAYFEQHIQQLVREREPAAVVEIVEWATINDEAALQYQSLITFACNLEKHLQSGPLWPVVELTDDDIATLTLAARSLCPTLRNEACLPDVEYEVEHRLPIIPEPLAFVSLSRREQRADPVASMGCALVVTLVILGLVILLLAVPPWVPSK